MKKQTNPTKAHLLRSAFILLSLFALCMIPFALGHGNTGKRSTAVDPSGVTPASTGAITGTFAVPAKPEGVGGCNVLIVEADGGVQANMLKTSLLAAGASSVDFFDGQNGTPTLAQLQPYKIVVPFSNFGYADGATLGNNLDSYISGGGVVVAFNFDWYGGGQSITGNWLTNDSPFNNNATVNFSTATLGTCTFAPLCNGVTTLSDFYREIPTLTSGATQAGTWSDGSIMMAYKGRTVGISGYVGDNADNWSGQFAQIILNAGSWQGVCGGCNPAWQNEPPMLAARAFASGAVANNAFHALTGFNGTGYVTESDFFNGTSWAMGAPIPVGHSQSRATAISNNIYVPGGFNSIQFGGPLTMMQIYNTTANTWSNGTDLPAARSGPAVAAFNGLVYIIAGFTTPFPTATNTVYIYNPGTNSYTTGAPMPAPSGNVPGALLGNEIFVVGGSAPTTVAYAYNPTANTWRSITPPSPADCQAGGAFTLNGELWLVGCLGQTGTNVKIYNPGSDSWRAGPSLNNSHEGGSATSVYNTRGYVAGGGTSGAASTNVESVGSCAPTVTSAVSRKTHGGAGTFDINMPLTGSSGVECRSGGATHDYSLVVTFSGNVTVNGMPQAQVITGTGCVGTGGTCDPNGTVSVSGSVVTVPLTNIADVQVINVQINGVNGASDEPAVNVNIPMGFLVGDVTGNRTVNASDVALDKAQVGQPVGMSNFREDVNVNGTISATDVALVKSDIGHALPP